MNSDVLEGPKNIVLLLQCLSDPKAIIDLKRSRKEFE